MPFISVRMLEGRDQEQKKKLVKSITDVMETVCGADPQHVHVVIEEVPKDSWARGGVMASDRA
jgi:4-oxalocrotonate tautomerase